MHDKMLPGRNDLTENIDYGMIERAEPVSAGAFESPVYHGEREEDRLLDAGKSGGYRILVKPDVTRPFKVLAGPRPLTRRSHQVA